MNYLVTYTAGRARTLIEDFQGLTNGSQIALQVLNQRFGQNAMIVEALKALGLGLGGNFTNLCFQKFVLST